MGYVMAGLVFLGVGQMWASSVDAKGREAEAAADAAWATAEPLGIAVRASRARVLHVSDSLAAVVALAEGRAAEAAHRASEAAAAADTLGVILVEGRTQFRAALSTQLHASFDRLTTLDDQRHEQMEIALSETQAEAVELRQALRTLATDRDSLRDQLGRETMAQDALEEAIRASQAEADRWKRVAHPGFVLGLWRDLPKLGLAVLGGIALDRLVFQPSR